MIPTTYAAPPIANRLNAGPSNTVVIVDHTNINPKPIHKKNVSSIIVVIGLFKSAQAAKIDPVIAATHWPVNSILAANEL